MRDFPHDCGTVDTYVLGLGFRVRFGVRVNFRVKVRVNYVRDSFSVLLPAQGDSIERYPETRERCFHIIVPGQPKFDFNTVLRVLLVLYLFFMNQVIKT